MASRLASFWKSVSALSRRLTSRRSPAASRRRKFLVENLEDRRVLAFGTPIINVAGQGNTGVLPPDTVGDVGVFHYVQAVNGSSGARVTVYNKLTGAVAVPQFSMETLGVGGVCASGGGDPIVLYDQLADRWMLAEFTPPGGGDAFCMYVSDTGTPTSNPADWTRWQMNAPNFPDYPKITMWNDAYFIGANEGDNPAYALNRNQMLTGAGGVINAIRFATPDRPNWQRNHIMPADLEGFVPAPAGSPGIFVRQVDDEYVSGANTPATDYLEIWEFDPDFTTPANSTYVLAGTVPIADFDYNLGDEFGRADIEQLGTAVQLDALPHYIMWRLTYRNFGTYEALVGNFTADVNEDGTPDADGGTAAEQAGVRWFELRKPTGGSWGLHQEAEIAPDATTHRWMASAAMNLDGDIAVGYSASSSSIFPAIRYAGREAEDALNTLQPENTLIAGGSFQSSSSNRWGDYSSMNVDPVDDHTFWYTTEYVAAATTVWTTRIGSFAFDDADVNIFGTVGNDDMAFTLNAGNVEVRLGGTLIRTIPAATLNSLTIHGLDGNDNITLTGLNLAASVTVLGGAGTNSLMVTNSNLNGSAGDGLNVTDVGTFTVSNSMFNNHTGDGIQATNVGAVSFTDVTATGNDPAVNINGFVSFMDVGGDYSNNLLEGVLLQNGGPVTLDGTTADDNGADGVRLVTVGVVDIDNVSFTNNGGDGADITDSTSVDLFNGFADDNDGHGVVVDDSGDVSLDSIDAIGNGANGLRVTNAGNVTINLVEVSSNAAEGILVDTSLDVDISDFLVELNTSHGAAVSNSGNVTIFFAGAFQPEFSANGGDGIRLSNVGDVDLTDVMALDNDGSGVSVATAGAVTLANVTADSNGDNVVGGWGALVDGAASLLATDSSFDGNTFAGLDFRNVAGDVSVSDSTADGNGGPFGFDGIFGLQNGGNITLTNVSASNNDGPSGAHGARLTNTAGDVTVTNATIENNSLGGLGVTNAGAVTIQLGSFSSNGQDGVQLNTVGAVDIDDITANGNMGDGLNIVDGDSGITIDQSTFDDNDGDGVDISGSTDVTMDDAGSGLNMAGNGGFGVRLTDVATVDLTSGLAENNDLGGMRIVGALDVTIDFWCLNNNLGGDGAYLEDVGAVTVDQSFANNNPDAGLEIVTATSVTILDSGLGSQFNNNGGDGIRLDDVGDVDISDTSANDNTGDGIRGTTVGAVTFTNVTATGNDPGVEIDGFVSFLDVGGDYSNNLQEGILLQNGGPVTLDGTTANDNGADGVRLNNVGAVDLTDVTANGNGGDGLDIDGAGVITITTSTLNANLAAALRIANATELNLVEVTLVGNGVDSQVTDVPTVNLFTTAGAVIDEVSIDRDSFQHTRAGSAQDTVAYTGVANLNVDTDDGNDIVNVDYAGNLTAVLGLDGGPETGVPGDKLNLDHITTLPLVFFATENGSLALPEGLVNWLDFECFTINGSNNFGLNTLYIEGEDDTAGLINRRDRIIISSASPAYPNGNVYVSFDISSPWGETGGQKYGPFQLDLLDEAFPPRIVVYGNSGDDDIQIAGNVPAEISAELHGEDGNDLLAGGAGNDLLVGGAGNDTVQGGEGNNVLWGDLEGARQSTPIGPDYPGDGNDTLQGRSGNDFLFGGGGNDNLSGAAGNDYLHGGDGNDMLTAGDGNDILRGEAGNDTLNGDQGDDILLGGDGSDKVYGRQGRDLMFGGAGSDTIQDDNAVADISLSGTSSYDLDNGPISAADLRGNNDLALLSILALWQANVPALVGATSAQVLAGRTAINGSATPLVSGANAFDDGVLDSVIGYPGATSVDWILADPGYSSAFPTRDRLVNTTGDVISDLVPSKSSAVFSRGMEPARAAG